MMIMISAQIYTNLIVQAGVCFNHLNKTEMFTCQYVCLKVE